MSNLTEAPRKGRISSARIRGIVLDNTIYIVIFVIFAVMVAVNPALLAWGNIEFIMSQAATRIILALGMASIIMLGLIDVSLGRMVGMTGVVIASLVQAADYSRRIFKTMPSLPEALPISGVILLSGVVMVVLGLIIAKVQVPSFIASLSFSLIVYGALSIYFDAVNDSSPIGGLSVAFKTFAQGSIHIGNFRVAYLVIYAAAVAAIFWFIWNKTRLGKNMYAIGGNVEAANVSGVNITRTIIIIFGIAGLLYGFGGVLETGRVGSATSSLGYGYELDAIAACVVGGVSMRGGIGRISGVIIGCLIFQLISYGLVFLGVNPYTQYLIKGLIILFAISVDTQKNIKRR